MIETFLPCNKAITYIERKGFEITVNQKAMLTLATTLNPQLEKKSSDPLTTAQETFLVWFHLIQWFVKIDRMSIVYG